MKERSVVNMKKKFLIFFKNLGVIVLFMVAGLVVVWIHSLGTDYNNLFNTKRSISQMSKNDSIPIGFEPERKLSLYIVGILDSTVVDNWDDSNIKLFENVCYIKKMSESFFCVVNDEKDSIIIQKLNKERVQIMNILYYNEYIDEINEVFEE